MADIRVDRNRPSVWPWIVGLLILAVLIWALVEIFGSDTEPVVDSPAGAAAASGTSAGASAPVPFPETSDTSFQADSTALSLPEGQAVTADSAQPNG